MRGPGGLTFLTGKISRGEIKGVKPGIDDIKQ
jgi:hypothetical protein